MKPTDSPDSPGPREVLVALGLALLVFAVPLWRGIVDSDSIVFGVDTATAQAPWSSVIRAADAEADREPPRRPRNPATADQGHQFYPLYLWAARSYAAGELPAWNPDIYAGAPGLANPQAGVLDPQVAPLFALHALGGRDAFDRGLVFLAWGRLVAAGLGAFLLARLLGLARGPAAFAGAAFGLSGYVMLWLNWSLGHVAPLLPWVLVALEGTRGARPWRAAAGAALALAFAVLAGHPETAFYVGAVGGLWALAILREDRRAGLIGLAGLTVGTLASALSLLPFVEYLFLSGAKVIRDAEAAATTIDFTALGLVCLVAAMATWYARVAVGGSGARRDAGQERADARRYTLIAGLGLALGLVGAATILSARGLSATAPLVLWPDLFGAPGDAGGYRGPGVYVEAASGWVPFAALALAAAAILSPSGPLGRRRLVIGLGGAALLLCLEVPGVLDLYRKVPLVGLGATERFGPVSGLFLALLGAEALQASARPARLAAALALLALGGVALLPGDEPALPAELTALDPADELFATVLAPAAEPDVNDMQLEGWLHPTVPVDRAVLRVARLDARGVPIAESCFSAPIELRTEPTEVARAKAPDAVAAAPEGARFFRAPYLVGSALDAGTWRFAVDVFTPASAEKPAATRVVAVSRVLRPRGVQHVTLLLALASLAGMLLVPAGTRGMAFAFTGLVLAQGWYFARGLNPAMPRSESFPATQTEAVLAEILGPYRFFGGPQVLPPNTGLVRGLRALDGYDAMDVADYNWYRGLCLPPGANGLLAWNARGVLLDSPAFRLLGVGALVLNGPLEAPGWELVAGPAESGAARPAEAWVYRALDPVPRAFCASEIVSLEEIGARLDAGTWDPRTTACLDAEWRPSAPFTRAEVGVPEWTNNTVRVEAELDGDGLLVLTDQAFPGWEARVDGEPAELFTADGIFRGVPLTAGRHTVEFVYAPWTIQVGAILSVAGLFAGVVFLFLGRRRPA